MQLHRQTLRALDGAGQSMGGYAGMRIVLPEFRFCGELPTWSLNLRRKESSADGNAYDREVPSCDP